ncbi:hypothetical protein Cs7R123_64650 [Catellatospora sp. TT07R-123]|uniref:hypothetical protein n=1 Tax=Catellatospora sp. TT07R-123 TaxID=2733863 RepID=UPI001B0C4CBA|nr:hypothetical protein [Catellatospora sp. TT07R-123]GHJ49123.1 hypothetical protein Cs7R123_64650 [Catellatospora sp. TT07R-123]
MTERQRDDRFMVDSALTWRGNRLMRHLVGRVDPAKPYVDLSIHSLWALLAVRPGLPHDDPESARQLYRRAESLVEAASVSRQSRRELESIIYCLRVEGWEKRWARTSPER